MTDPTNTWWDGVKTWLAGSMIAGGFVGALLSKLHTKVKGPSQARYNDLMQRIDQLETDRDRMDRDNQRKLAQITYELREIRARLP